MQVSEIQLVYRTKVKATDRLQVSTSNDAYQALLSVWDMDTIEFVEHFKILLLNNAGRVLGYYHLSSGSTQGCLVDPKLVFTAALKANAPRIILAHNHPSGSIKPSNGDKTVTQRLKEGGHLLDIQIDDHLIVTPTAFFSFADEGLL
ncbi:JAB domain-containing protein [Mucilaginibacter defluvii]|uniref:JAB domain-containing protein n=1 Tax=Mucilaginibacter defluvii TaxID=1196019 RepID=A0ABP9FL75_9SPHI